MKIGRRIVLLLALVALFHAPVRAGEEEDPNSKVLFIASIASPLRFITSFDGFASTIADGVRGMEEVVPGTLAASLLMDFPVPPKTVEMDRPVYFILPVEEVSKDLCVVVFVPDFDEFLKGVDLYSSLDVEDEDDPDSRRSAYLSDFGECYFVKAADHVVLLGRDDAALRWLRGVIGDLRLEHRDGWTATVSFNRPIRFDKDGVLNHGAENIVGQIDGIRSDIAANAERAGFDSKMLMGLADLLQIAVRGAVGEVAALKEVRLSVNFDRDNFDATLALTPDEGSVTELMQGAVGYLTDAEYHEPGLAASVPADAVGLGRFVLMVQDPDYAEKLVEWVGLVADKVAPARKDEMVALFADRFASGNPGEMVQYFVQRGGRDVSVAYVQTEDAEAFIGEYEKALKLMVDLFNSFLGEAPGKGLRLGFAKLPDGGDDAYTLNMAVGLGSKLGELYYQIPRDVRAEIDKRLADIGFLIGRVGDTAVIVSGSVLPEDLEYAKGFLESSPDAPFLGAPGPAATLRRLPSGESGFYSLVDIRGVADLVVSNLKRESGSLDIDPHDLDRLSKAFVGGGNFAGVSMAAGADSLFVTASAPTKGLNEAVKNFSKLFRFIEDGSYEDDD